MIEQRIAAHLAELSATEGWQEYAKWARANYIAILITPFKRLA